MPDAARSGANPASDAAGVELVPILAVARNGVIGVEGRLPWRLPEDLRRFKAITTGHPIIMGRKTFASIGRPLPGRHNIVVTRDRAFAAPGIEVTHSVEEAVQAAAARDRVAYVIGGAEIYRATLPLARRVHLTVIDRDFAGDARLDPLDPALRYVFVDLERVPPRAEGPGAAPSWGAFLRMVPTP
ncbi:MAG TPA: dihydrofolate reductase [Candidatus Thermoplasmatota archaeon]|nr:dihydrofolate reductase [Candidatus Thermoplasmatota archaeon]